MSVFTLERPAYLDILRTLRRAGVFPSRAFIAGDLRAKLLEYKGMSSQTMSSRTRSYLPGRFQQGVIRRGVDIVCALATEIAEASADGWMRTPSEMLQVWKEMAKCCETPERDLECAQCQRRLV